MADFRKRIVQTAVEPLDIGINQLQELDIPVPLLGEVLDIIYV
jgi:hypothetical protein